LALAGSALLWLALPPVGWSLLAWLAPAPWIVLVRRRQLVGRRPYLVLWFAGFVFWLATLHWMTLPHWATSFGWIGISLYLACYLPVFVAVSRVGVHSLKLSPIAVTPVVWTGLELARGHLLSGFGIALVSHTQYRWPLVLQLSDLGGAYLVSFVMLAVAASLACLVPCDARRWSPWPLAPLAATLAAVFFYGHWQSSHVPLDAPLAKVALIQGSIDSEMKHDPNEFQRIYDDYVGLSRQAVAEHPDVELVVWPETMFPYPWFTYDDDFQGLIEGTYQPQALRERSQQAVGTTTRAIGRPCLFGIGTYHETTHGTEHYNSGLFVDQAGGVLDRYDKNHLVMFGEYVPLAKTFPWLYRLTPLPGGADAGDGPRAVRIGSTCYAANICYENTVPHLVRAQVLQLRQRASEPDLLVTLTNDGWFWGSAELDIHLACGVFRAIECRKPCLIAANTGFSAWIDPDGHIRAQGPRRANAVVMARPALEKRVSFYLEHGDLVAGTCLALSAAVAVVGLRQHRPKFPRFSNLWARR
jgi:apolipoprotein N-acyltransferase